MRRDGEKRSRRALLVLSLLAIAFGAPVALAAYLLNAASAPAPLHLAGRTSPLDPSAATPLERGVNSGPVTSPLVRGVLYTNGPVKVNWNGIRIPVENTSYVYSGGELIRTSPNAMGILKLDSGSIVFICPNSRVRVSRNPSGETLVEVKSGSGRFMFGENKPFRVHVNNTILSAAPDASGDALTRHAYTGEAVATEDGGCVFCNLSKNLAVSTDDGHGRRTTMAGGGDILTVKGKSADGLEPISNVRLPGDVFAGMRAAMVSNGATGLGYLCKCRELREYAERAARRVAGDADPFPSETLAAAGNGAGPGLPPLPDAQPAIAPPPVPDVTMTDAGEPDPFQPGLLPAAGDQQPQTDSDVSVPPPLVPGSGPGGGGTVSAS